jgi:phosphoribosylformylglycinamidine synthase I
MTARPRVLILRAPGTNCDQETAFAFQQVGAETEQVHINRLLDEPTMPDRFQILCLPGGFSYGDDIAAGRILATQVRHHLAETMDRFHRADKLILGICNGFQVLIQTGLLLAADESGRPPATLTGNESGKYEDRWVPLRVEGQKCVFLRGVQRLYLPVAHAEGKFVCRNPEVFDRLQAAGQLVLRYSAAGDSAGAVPGKDRVAYPDNPNGSEGNVAGICDTTGRVLGLMPHPERFIDGTQHPRWTRQPLLEEGAGLVIFRNAVQYFED